MKVQFGSDDIVFGTAESVGGKIVILSEKAQYKVTIQDRLETYLQQLIDDSDIPDSITSEDILNMAVSRGHGRSWAATVSA